MNNLFQSMDPYKIDLDSIGTEASPAPDRHHLNSKKSQHRHKGRVAPTQNKQLGGGFIDSLLGLFQCKKEDPQKQEGTVITKQIMSAIERNDFEGADNIMRNNAFVPDLTVVDKKGHNLIQALIRAGGRINNADEALRQIIINNENKDAVKKALNETEFIVVTDRDPENFRNLESRRNPENIRNPESIRNPENGRNVEGIRDLESGISGILNMFEQNNDESEPVINSSGRPVELSIYHSAPTKTSGNATIFSNQKVTAEDSTLINTGMPNIEDIVRGFITNNDTDADTVTFLGRTDTDMNTGMNTGMNNRVMQKSLNNEMSNEEIMAKLRNFKATDDLQRRTPNIPFQVMSSQVMVPTNIAVGARSQKSLSPPVSAADLSLTSDAFVNLLAEKIATQQKEQEQSQVIPVNLMGGAKAKPKTNGKTNRKSITTKTMKVVGTRKMIGFSDVETMETGTNNNDNDSDMFGGMSDNEMKNITRAATNQKNQFHEETLEKIMSHLSGKDKDLITAKAIKAIIYDEIKRTKEHLSGLDRAAEMLKAVSDKKIAEVLKQKELMNKIVSYLTQKAEEREKTGAKPTTKPTNTKDAKEKKTTKAKTTKTSKGETGGKANNNFDDFESSVEDTSDTYSYSDESEPNSESE